MLTQESFYPFKNVSAMFSHLHVNQGIPLKYCELLKDLLKDFLCRHILDVIL